jgi:hypothetical protein
MVVAQMGTSSSVLGMRRTCTTLKDLVCLSRLRLKVFGVEITVLFQTLIPGSIFGALEHLGSTNTQLSLISFRAVKNSLLDQTLDCH